MLRTRALMLLVGVLLVEQGSSLLLDGDSLDALKLELNQERQARYQLESTVNQLQSTLSHVVESLNTECTLKCPARQSVAFMAELSKTLDNPANGHVVVFDAVHTNEGNAYNPLHGIFTTPVNGTYNFNLVVSTPSNAAAHSVHLLIKLNGQTTGYIFLDQNALYWLRRSTDVTLHLAKGDEIWVEVDSVTGPHAIGGCCFHTHLSGFLIQSD